MTHEPLPKLSTVLAETLAANALRVTSNRGGYVGDGQPHATLDSDPEAIDAIARGLLARKVEPSRSTPQKAAAALLDAVEEALGERALPITVQNRLKAAYIAVIDEANR